MLTIKSLAPFQIPLTNSAEAWIGFSEELEVQPDEVERREVCFNNQKVTEGVDRVVATVKSPMPWFDTCGAGETPSDVLRRVWEI